MITRRLIVGSASILTTISYALGSEVIGFEGREPQEYVQICYAYGTGFFYLPGTDTCFRVSGYVWFQSGATNDNGSGEFNSVSGRYEGDAGNYNGFRNGGNSSTRARINIDTRSETDLGTLRTYARLQADVGDSYDGTIVLDQSYVQLAGFRVGHIESAWAETVKEVSSYGSHSWNSMWTGYQQRNLIQYNFGGEKEMFGAISLEQGDSEGYVPDVVVLVGYEGGLGALWLRAGYDADYGSREDGLAVSAGGHINVGSSGSSFRLLAYYANGDHAFGSRGPTYIGGGYGNAKWSALASYYQQVAQTFGASVAAQHFRNFYQPHSDTPTGIDGWSAEVALVWIPFTDLEFRTEVQYDDVAGMNGAISGFIRIARSF